MHLAALFPLRLPLIALLALLLQLAAQAALAGETPDSLAARYAREVDRRLQLPADEVRRYAALALQSLRAEAIAPILPQYLVLVDRSPRVQALLLFWLTPLDEAVLIGASPISTGRGGEFEYFETPTGVFTHTLDNPDFRAEGTLNEKGIRGFGRRGMRVFDFGWHPARRTWDGGGTSPMRLLLHATDPERLEPLLGSVQSKGCIRAPTTLIQLLDDYGLLDADYDAAQRAGQQFWVLSPQRSPVHGAGRYLVIVDTGRDTRPDWSPAPARRPPRAAPPSPPASAPQNGTRGRDAAPTTPQVSAPQDGYC